MNFPDGELRNNIYHKVAEDIEKILEQLKPEVLISYEPQGMSGHLDHIAVAFITKYVFYRLDFAQELMETCWPEKISELEKDYFVYFPKGYNSSTIDLVVDVSEVWETKVKAMHAHASQKEDVERILGYLKELPKEEYFLLEKK